MKLSYTKITKNTVKFFYEDEKNGYGEFYIKFRDIQDINGEAVVEHKDFDYSQALLKGLVDSLVKPAKKYKEE